MERLPSQGRAADDWFCLVWKRTLLFKWFNIQEASYDTVASSVWGLMQSRRARVRIPVEQAVCISYWEAGSVCVVRGSGKWSGRPQTSEFQEKRRLRSFKA